MLMKSIDSDKMKMNHGRVHVLVQDIKYMPFLLRCILYEITVHQMLIIIMQVYLNVGAK